LEDVGEDRRRLIGSLLREVPDHPSPGVLFRDITPLLADPSGLRECVHGLVGLVPQGVRVVAGVEARGFVLGSPMAVHLGVGFVPIRKVGKLPGPTQTARYDLEYGTAEIEVHSDAFAPGEEVVIVDDVLATGGTAVAACELVEAAGARVRAVVVLLELEALAGRLPLAGRDVRSLLVL